MKNKNLIFSLFLLVLSIGLVSAFWPFSMTGKVVDGTVVSNSDKCSDTDNGVNSSIAGATLVGNIWGKTASGDRCSGTVKVRYDSAGKAFNSYPSLIEVYCDSDKKQEVTFNSTQLGSGYCVAESITVAEKAVKSAKWVSDAPVCIKTNTGVKDQFGKAFNTGCGNGVNSSIYYNYTCEGNSTEGGRGDFRGDITTTGKIVLATQNCSLLGSQGKCSVSGCYGNYTDNDEANNKDVAGVLIIDGVSYPDECNAARTYVKQFKAVNGKKAIVPVSKDNVWSFCGTNRECAIENNTGAGYCRDKYAGTDTITSLSLRITELNSLIASLTDRINALESANEGDQVVDESTQ